mmetsp:Transcript_2816/g.5572  ORF Transcript_2816/g.5572 Transcript_2816/m.5572 type:complete len:200 (-) Transcript_2816:213-812(-)
MLRKQAHKLEVGFEAYKQQQSLQMLQGDSSSMSSAVSPNGGTKNGTTHELNDAKGNNKIENMRADAAKIEAAAIAKEAQVDARIENNKFMRKELEKRMQESEKTRDELILASRKNANANSYINSAVRRVDSIQHTLDEQVGPAAQRANMKVNDLVEKMHDPEDLSKFATEGLSRSTPGYESNGGSWLDMFQKNIKFTWE